MRALVVAVSIAVLTACGQSAVPALGPLARVGDAARPHAMHGKLVVRIRVPHADRRARFVSPSTKALTIRWTGPSSGNVVAGLTPSSPQCQTSGTVTVCTVGVALPTCPTVANCYTASLSTYDAVACTSGGCTIPPSAKQLSALAGVTFPVTSTTTSLSFTLQGIPASVAVAPAIGSAITGSQAAGFELSHCAAPQAMTVTGIDADGNTIVGPGAPGVMLASSDPSVVGVTSAGGPSNVFVVSVVKVSGPGSVTLRATAAAGERSGVTTPASADVKFATTGIGLCNQVQEYHLPSTSSLPLGITAGSDGALWFVEASANHIGRIPPDATVANPKITEYPLPSAGDPVRIAAGPDGALWFTECATAKIGRIPTNATPGSSAQITEYATPTTNSHPAGIAAGPDKALWFVECGSEYDGQVGRIPTTATPANPKITEYPFPNSGVIPTEIALGPDGAMWITEFNTSKLARIPLNATPGSSSGITEYPLPSNNQKPNGLASDPSGKLWFALQNGDAIGYLPDTATPGSSAQFNVISISESYTGPEEIVRGADGAFWFTERGADKIGRIPANATDASGLKEYPLTAGAEPYGITLGPDGAIWFTERTGNAIGRIY
ncbi:MAG: hypothetical protein JO199_03130 [Candidatus Eremiobacteraeota bacterium]|nr:hypothetical protein [Candidatus Eremiobacteraeota bacterium]